MSAQLAELQMPKKECLALLDEAIVSAVLAHAEVAHLPYVEDSGAPILENIRLHDDKLLDVVFLSDAKAHASFSEDSMPDKSLWVAEAIRGARRASRINPMVGLSKRTRLFSPERADLQEEAYDDMHLRRGSINEQHINHWVGEAYAQRVALGEIALLPRTSADS